jgi:hypothetical protein
MNPSASSSSQLGPLNPGDVVSAALRLYRDRFKPYIQLSALATVWLIGGIVALVVVMGVLIGIFSVLGGELMAILGGLIGLVVGFLPLLYGSAKYYLLSAAIGRLSFSDLVSQPETTLAVRQRLNPKLSQFLLMGFLLFLVYIAAYLVAVLAALISGGALGLVTAGILSALINAPAGGAFGVVLGLILGVGVFLLVLLWVLARTFIAEVVLAIEPNQDASSSLGRSWDLTKTSNWRIQIVFLATFLIQLPIIMVTNYLPSLFLAFLPDNSAVFALSQTLSIILSLVGSILVLPLWQAVKGVLYYDLRSRREGLDLELRHQSDDGLL